MYAKYNASLPQLFSTAFMPKQVLKSTVYAATRCHKQRDTQALPEPTECTGRNLPLALVFIAGLRKVGPGDFVLFISVLSSAGKNLLLYE